MDVCLGISHKRLYGEVVISEIPRDEWGESAANNAIVEKHLYEWRPPFQIACNLPNDFTFQMECWVDKRGMRRFMPKPTLVEFLPWAALVGQRLLVDRGELINRSPLSVDVLRFLHGIVRSTSSYIGETRNLSSSLRVSRGVRAGNDIEDRDNLPDIVGQDSNGEGQRWSLDEFMSEGRQAARAAGIAKPTKEDVFAHGLYRAAEIAPITPKPREIKGLITSCLYCFDPSVEKPKRASINYVAKQLKEILEEHRYDTQEEFRRWQEDSKSDLIHRIAKKSDCPLDRKGVRRALLELEKDWLKVYADCIDAAMRTFCAALPVPLKRHEKQLYRLIYLKDKRFGNLPFAVLSSRLDYCKVATLPIWNDPSNNALLGVLYRYLTFFPESLDKQRRVDRSHKQGSALRNESARQFGLVGDQLKDTLQEHIESHLKCDLEFSDWDIECLEENGDRVSLLVICDEQKIHEALIFSIKKLKAMANS